MATKGGHRDFMFLAPPPRPPGRWIRCWIPSNTKVYPWFSFSIQMLWPFCNKSPPPHLQKCQNKSIIINRLTHSSITLIQPLRQLYESPITGWERLIRTRFSKLHLIRSYCEIFFYHFPNISCIKCTVNSNFHLIRGRTLLTNDFELTIRNL